MPPVIHGRLGLEGAAGGRASADRLRMLDAVAQAGTITGAGRLLGLSYRAAWDAVRGLNTLFGRPLVVATHGGAGGGGRAGLTAAGERVRAELARVDHELQAAIGRLQADLASPGPQAEPQAITIWRGRALSREAGEVLLRTAAGTSVVASRPPLSPSPPASSEDVEVAIPPAAVLLATRALHRTSARNCWLGRVADRTDHEAGVLVRLRLDTGDDLIAAVTHESADRLALLPGAAACAIVKASQVSVTA